MKNDNNSNETIDNEILKEAAELTENLKIHPDPREEEIKQLKEQVLRVAAEAENSKKRFQKEIEEARSYSVTNMAKDLIIMMDNLNRSLESLSNSEDDNPRVKAVIEGIEVMKKELFNAFARHNIQSVEPKQGDNFDHNFHQAISQIPTNDVQEGKVFDLLQVGYLIKDRLIRPALVSLAKATS